MQQKNSQHTKNSWPSLSGKGPIISASLLSFPFQTAASSALDLHFFLVQRVSLALRKAQREGSQPRPWKCLFLFPPPSPSKQSPFPLEDSGDSNARVWLETDEPGQEKKPRQDIWLSNSRSSWRDWLINLLHVDELQIPCTVLGARESSPHIDE